MKPKFFDKNQRVIVIDRDGMAWIGNCFAHIDNDTCRVLLNVNREIVCAPSSHVFPLGYK